MPGSNIAIAALRLTFSVLAFCVVSAAEAQQPSAAQQSAVRQNCRSDYMSYCSSVPPGGAASVQCLQQNSAKLSPACAEAVSALSGPPPAAAPAAAPAPDAASPAAAPPPAATPAPTAAAPAEPPAPAAAARPAGSRPMSRREEIEILRADCRYDFRRFCRRVPLGGGRVIGCLVGHKDMLSPACRGSLASFL